MSGKHVLLQAEDKLAGKLPMEKDLGVQVGSS